MRRTIFSEGEFYHLYNRGVDKRQTFSSAGDYRRFLAYLYLHNNQAKTHYSYFLENFKGPASRLAEEFPRGEEWQPLVALGAYCLMPNHFHLYATPLVENGISKFMQRVQTGYTMYFNEKYGRSGSLFQGTFKAQHVDSERHAKYLFSYIHLNAAKLKDAHWKERGARDLRSLREYVREYPHSSLGEYIKGTHIITSPDKFPAYLRSREDIDGHIDDFLGHRSAFLEV